MVIWNDQFVIGSRTIDLQHRMLINNTNHLECMLTNRDMTREEVEFVIHLVDFLEAYAETHFKFEEGCMERHRCPAHAQNQQAHEQFRKFFQEYKERIRLEGFHPDLLRQLHQKLNSWIQEHILTVDTQLRPCLKDRS